MTRHPRKSGEVSASATVKRRYGAPASVQLKVPFHDCDPLFVVWHGRYLQYMEVARSALLASHQIDAKDVAAMGYKMFVTEVRCRYLSPLTYNDEFRVTARLTAVTPLLRVSYELVNLTQNRKSARAVTALATTDLQDNLLETPDGILARIQDDC